MQQSACRSPCERHVLCSYSLEQLSIISAGTQMRVPLLSREVTSVMKPAVGAADREGRRALAGASAGPWCTVRDSQGPELPLLCWRTCYGYIIPAPLKQRSARVITELLLFLEPASDVSQRCCTFDLDHRAFHSWGRFIQDVTNASSLSLEHCRHRCLKQRKKDGTCADTL